MLNETNLPPPSVDLQTLRAAIDERTSIITTYSEEIEGLELKQEEIKDQIQALDIQRLQVEAELEKLKFIHFGIRHLPPEILGTIFYFCVENEWGNVVPLSSVAPLLLCRVCSLWRKVALGTPRLWARLEIEVKPDILPDEYRNMLSFLLKNGAALPRELQITADYIKAPDSSLAVLSAIHPALYLVQKLLIYGDGF
ncbi:hypothetical protein BDZ94DRAFT_1267291 [Collybia nuda]|uniref:F-box domain-containing protein n=1 Tax=Collybia nuda TaxID=64659 RepID=A0A9P5Y017_9AGAR|nr:hypothetical protein BDZ94DRAFT_1267291 [Collybia nuda]